MPDLKLPRLPDRTPAKFSITVTPELAQALREYADLYCATYGAAEEIGELIPYMLAAFLDGDAAFKKARRVRLDFPTGQTAKRRLSTPSPGPRPDAS